jgi:peptidyl-prolyl cis-trans isomerase SurA
MTAKLIDFKKFIFNFFLIIFIFHLSFSSQAKENKILFSINQEIITTVDLLNEINYLRLLNEEVKNLDNKTLIEIAKNSLIKNTIKKIELKKNIKEIKLKDQYLDKLIRNMYLKIGLENENDFETTLKENNINIKEIREKISIEIIWNQLIYKKFINQIKIDKEKIKRSLSNKNIQYQKKYLLSEIVFEVKEDENLDDKTKLIEDNIKNNGFKNTALLFSIADTSKLGGSLGWINENSISKKIKQELSRLKIGQQTNAILIPGGFIILNVDNISEEKKEINFKDELNRIINDKTNEQLTQFSNIYFNKVKKNFTINEI